MTGMTGSTVRFATLAAAIAVAACVPSQLSLAQRAPSAAVTGLTAAERTAGWKPLFDGRSLAGWQNYHLTGKAKGWRAVNGTLERVGKGGDLVTRGTYANFELALDWKIWPGGNSGILYRIDDAGEATYVTGPEMQVLDDAGHADGRSPLTSAGADYGLYAAPAGVVHPAGQWNSARLLVNGNHVEHWLNGKKVVEYELASRDWEAKVQASKFKAWPGYGRAKRGRIGLQDHGDRVAYRHIRIRVLP